MKKHLLYLISLLILSSCSQQKKENHSLFTPGVSDSLATYRHEVLSNIRYVLHFNIPLRKQQDITAHAQISFDYSPLSPQQLCLDFKEDPKKIKTIQINHHPARVACKNEHLILDTTLLKAGNNHITIDFIAGNGALNRREDFLYTLFVPDRARTAFPCFDQPDLKAVFDLSLTIPRSWVAMANGLPVDSVINDTAKTLHYAPTEKLPTYLFSFVAGAFHLAREPWRGQNIDLLYRETDSEKISASIPAIFEQYKKYVRFYEQWTGIPYPFQKYGMVAIPDFQFGGMEHPGAILLKASTLFLTQDATRGQLNSRAQLLTHELAHTWFGDMVTMKWFNDVWTKEVFANFMADKATATPGYSQGFALKFLTDHLPSAYGIDRTLGANPIRQPLNNLEDAGTLYGGIIYDKAPVMMRQLEYLMGKKNFQNGVKLYLKKYAYGNASWPDLIHILNNQTKADLIAWNKVWVNKPGRPVFNDSIVYENGLINNFYILQKPEFGKERIWPQFFDIDLHYDDGKVLNFSIDDSLAEQRLTKIIGQKKPAFILYNASGMGYGVWPVDTSMYSQLFTLKDYVNRASAYISLYENMLNGRDPDATKLLDLFISGLGRETVELNLRLMTNYISSIYWEFISAEARKAKSQQLEQQVWSAMRRQESAHNKKILLECYESIFESQEAQKRLFGIWKNKKPPTGVAFNEDDYTGLAFALALRADHPGMLDEQEKRIKNPDRKKRFGIIRPALSFDKAVRDSFFNSLTQKENRTNESAVGTALSYLHHPLRQPAAEKYLKKMLELLPEIQRTGDIFFPGRWLQSGFGRYQSASAYRIVQAFLKQHPQLPLPLKEKVLQATDNLRRAQTIVNENE